MGDTTFNGTAISTATTTLLKTGAGQMGGIFVTGGTAGTIKIYDGINASGTLVEDIGSTNAIGFYPIRRSFRVGLCIVTSAATTLTTYWK